MKAAWVDFRSGRKEQGASTLSMQLARNFWLDSDKSWRRKFAEMLITMRLEEKLSKEQIFEDYANQVYLGAWALSASTGSEQRRMSISGRTSASFQYRRQLSSPRSSSGRATTTPYVVRSCS